MADRDRVEQASHAVRLGKALRGLDQSHRLARRRLAREAIRTLEQPESGEEYALRHRSMHGGTCAPGSRGERTEINVGRQVRRAWSGERISRPAGPERLQRLSAGSL